MEKTKSKVALVRCSSYDREEVEKAIALAVELLGGFDKIFSEREGFAQLTKESKLVLKPNLLAKAAPEKAVTTHPEIFRAVGKLLQENGYDNLVYGDSPGNPMISVEKTAEGCGIKQVADQLGIAPGDFEHGTDVDFPEGRATKKFVLCNEVARTISANNPAGGIINICKMKTHQLERITGAVKNTFGCVYGVNKAATHASYKSPEHFARMLADLNNLVKPRLHIMDGVIAMEGNGPGSGDPVPMYVILASTDPVALDATFCHLVYLYVELAPTNVAAADAGVGFIKDDEIEVVLGGMPMQPDGANILLDDMMVKYGEKSFNVQRSKDYRGGFRILNILSPLFEKKPRVVTDKCIGCGICVATCPVEGKAIELKPRIMTTTAGIANSPGIIPTLKDVEGSPTQKLAVYDYEKCIKCYCCQEMCPEKAITVKKALLAKIIDRRWKI